MATVDNPASILGSEIDFDIEALRERYRIERDRRVRKEGAGQYLEATDELAEFSEDPWAVERSARAPVDVVTEVLVVGGGFGGLLMGARLREAGIEDFRMVEEGEDFGGTWYWNRYPGAMCDIDSLIYLPLLEETGRLPKHRYALQPEIFEHCQAIGHHYGLYERAMFGTSLAGLNWDGTEQRWKAVTLNGDSISARQVVLACGRQSLPKLPGIPGIRTFKGKTFHSARWDYDYTGGDSTGGLTKLRDKTVAIIGTGATAIQIVPHLGEWAKDLYVFQRTPSSVGVRANREIDPAFASGQAPGWQRQRMNDFTQFMANDQRERDPIADGWTEFARILTETTPEKLEDRLGRTPTAEELGLAAEIADFTVMNQLRGRIDGLISDPATAERLKPWYRWACKRPCFHDEYLQTFNRANVHLVDTAGQGVERFTPTGVVVDGTTYDVDCVIFATGFEAGISYTHLTGFEIHGRSGLSLSDHWSGAMRTVHGLSTDEFPNLFFMGGNAQTAAAVNAVHLLDEQSRQIGYVLKEARLRGATVVEADNEAGEAWATAIRQHPRNRAQFAFYAECTPGYYNNEGQAKSTEDIFQGGRYGDGPAAYFQLLAEWRAAGQLEGLNLS